MICPTCALETSDGNSFCPSCGSAMDSNSTPTMSNAVSPAARAPRSAPAREASGKAAGVLSSSSDTNPSGGARFVPGTVLLDRYRIVALAGKGGMGEVYRADDLKLGQTVALKFLPEAVAKDGAALARFHREVRIARQVSHANVCRVFDIGEVDGLPFLTMEYVDGEDLASLMRRIGRLGPDKALEISRQICAGVAAANEHGILHRDLKPANVMLDGRGKVRITDFGLAGLGDELRQEDVRAGTPAYMAPEQLAGKEVTQKSDIYSLGLVLYELFTGKRGFEATTMKELLRVRESGAPADPSTIVKDIDPLVERVILRCLEKDPAKRPATALQVAAALPGGDPLAAALAAGETPSPEMVAASGDSDIMRPVVAWGIVAAIVLLVAMTVVLNQKIKLFRYVPLEKPPEVLVERAREIQNRLGYTAPAAGAKHGFQTNFEFLRYISEHDKSATRWNNLDRGEVKFWYRESPRRLYAEQFFENNLLMGRVSPADPPMHVSGMTLVWLNPRGRLLGFHAVPPQIEDAAPSSAAPDWGVLFSEAGLDPAEWTSSEPQWNPDTYCDSRAAWTGVVPGRADQPLRIEAAGYRGKPVSFEIIGPWTRPERVQNYQASPRERASTVILIVILLLLMVGAVLCARFNLRKGRGDRRGAFRLGAFVFLAMSASWIICADHVAGAAELGLFIMFVSWALFTGGLTWLLYVALEPFVRRLWPTSIVTWSRVLTGKFRDPLVGRDVLIGCLAGATFSLLGSLQSLLPKWLGHPPPPLDYLPTALLLGPQSLMGHLLWELVVQLFSGLAIIFLMLAMLAVVRRKWAAAAAVVGIMSAINILQAEAPLLSAPFSILIWALLLLVLIRFGLVAVVVIQVFSGILDTFPITTDTSAWYASIGYFGLLLMALLVFYGFTIARGGNQALAAGGVEPAR
ncbi:MAG: serine/threonine protein kinase [Acidipila sp.]|nr:serine/threonine protein kinase [Acidipila sp.]